MKARLKAFPAQWDVMTPAGRQWLDKIGSDRLVIRCDGEEIPAVRAYDMEAGWVRALCQAGDQIHTRAICPLAPPFGDEEYDAYLVATKEVCEMTRQGKITVEYKPREDAVSPNEEIKET